MDAGQYLAWTKKKFDIIIIDSMDPVIKHREGLFTVSRWF